MSYCRYCGTELTYKRTKNDRWMPCNALTGEPHFCYEQKTSDERKTVTEISGIVPCPECGKPTFIQKDGKSKILYDYSTLQKHSCRKADLTRYQKYLERQKKLEPVKKEYEKKPVKKPSAKKKRNTVCKTKKSLTATKVRRKI
ncbi:MAG: hypothetical protein J5597_00365 [Spirochaetaceae bacterium]|nr:hypothetical protein [Spirochaetaceae bacterium]